MLMLVPSLAKAQHIINTNQQTKLYARITTLEESRIGFSYIKQDKEFFIERSFIKSIEYFGMDTELIRDNYALKDPYLLESIRLDDEIRLEVYKEVDNINVPSFEVKVLSTENGYISYLAKKEEQYIFDSFPTKDIAFINYSAETKNYLLDNKNEGLTKDRILTKSGSVLDVYVYELGPNTVRFSPVELTVPCLTYTRESTSTEYKTVAGLKQLPYSDIISVKLVDGTTYLPDVEVTSLDGKMVKRNRLISKMEFSVGGFGSSMLSSQPNFQNTSTVNGVTATSTPSEIANKYIGYNLMAGVKIHRGIIGLLGYRKMYSNTTKTNSFSIDGTSITERQQAVNYRNTISVIEIGVGLRTKQVYANLRLGRSNGVTDFYMEEFAYKSFENDGITKASGYYTSKPTTSYGLDLGYLISIRNISIVPKLSFDNILLETEGIVFSDIESSDAKYQNIQSKSTYNTTEVRDYFYVVPESTVILFSLALELIFTIN